MLLFLYIMLVCYFPLIGNFLPIISIVPGVPLIRLDRAILLIFFMTFPIIVSVRIAVDSLKNYWIISAILFALYVMLSVLWSDRTYTPVTIRFIFDSLFVPVIIGMIGLSLFRIEQSFTILLINYVVICLVLSMISCYQSLFPPQAVVRTLDELELSGIRASGTLGNPNLLAIFLVLGIPSALYLKDRRCFGNKAISIILAVIVAGLGATMSRKGALSAILSPVIYLFFTKRRRKAFIALCIGGGLLAVVFISTSWFSKRISADAIQNQLAGRVTMASIGLKMFYQSPIIGKGFGGYQDNFLKYNRDSDKAYSAHNIYAEALADYGLIGFSLLAACFLLPLHRATVLFRKSHIATTDPEHSRGNGALLLAVIIPVMFFSYFAGSFLYEPRFFSVLYAYISHAYRAQ